MKRNVMLMVVGCGLMAPALASAQSDAPVVVDYESISVTQVDAKCKNNYTSTWRDNWFLQLGAGIQSPFVEKYLPQGDSKHHLTPVYNLAFGRWMTPYLGWRLGGNYGMIRWDYGKTSTAKVANVNFDIMWDMCNSIGGVNSSRVFSVIPFVGLGGSYVWDFDAPWANVYKGNKIKKNEWMLPVSAGLQLRFRLCKYADFFVEGRASAYGDNFNNTVGDKPIDLNFSCIGGFNINFGGREFESYNPCDYLGYIASLNNQVNDLRGQLAVTSAALAQAESQLPCPKVETKVTNTAAPVETPMLSAVRFTINSAVVSPEEMVNVYNVAQYMKQNPSVNVVIKGYADKDTGTAAYNMKLSEKRAQAVFDILTKNYGINPSRLTIKASGSDSQPYPDNNNWNRIVIFAK